MATFPSRSPIAALAAALALAPPGNAAIPVPPGWFSGDLHVHALFTCVFGVDLPGIINSGMPADLNVVVPLLLCTNERQFDDPIYFRGQQDDPISTPGRIIHYDLEVSHCGQADRLGHMTYLYLSDLAFPEADYQGPIQEWARAQGAVVAADHVQFFASGPDEFGSSHPAAQFEAPVGVALGRVDILLYQPTATAPWRFLWYTLLDSGFRPGLAASSDSGCLPFSIGEARTYARVEGELTYEKFVRAVAAGRVSVVEQQHSFIEFQVDGVGTGEELRVATAGTPVALEARLILPVGQHRVGSLEILRNQQVVAERAFDQTGGEVVLSVADSPEASSWYAARTSGSHSGAVFVLVEGRSVRGSPASADYHARYLQWLEDGVRSGVYDEGVPTDDTALLADIVAARQVFERVRDEPVPEAPAALLGALGLLALLALRAGRRGGPR